MIGVRGGLEKNKPVFGRCITIEIIVFIFSYEYNWFKFKPSVSDSQHRKSFNNKIPKGSCFRSHLHISAIKQQLKWLLLETEKLIVLKQLSLEVINPEVKP